MFLQKALEIRLQNKRVRKDFGEILACANFTLEFPLHQVSLFRIEKKYY